MKDMQKRKRVMVRSMQLGHCICSPKQPCPCDIFRRQDLCPCAGERANGDTGPLRLMSLIDSAGCASKIDAATLQGVLQGLPFVDDPRVLVGVPAGDDAGVYKLSDDLALVQTVDVFSPSVDDPYTFGQIAAANSLSDVYAMGGRPITALSIVGYPIHAAPEEAMREILRGGLDKMAEAGVAVLGGHSIHDQQLKAGFAVTGLVHPQRIMTNAGAAPGDRLILTKPLGTGIVAFAGQIGLVAGRQFGSGRPVDGAAQPRRGGNHARVRGARLHRRNGLRSGGAPGGDGGRQPRRRGARLGRSAAVARRAAMPGRGDRLGRRRTEPGRGRRLLDDRRAGAAGDA